MADNRHDIETHDDIKLMVDSFYDKVGRDELLSYVFNDFAQVDWKTHLPKMYRFWAMQILGEQNYKGNPLAEHIPLPINETHFERWITLFHQNIDELFAGRNATITKLRAQAIAHFFQKRLIQIHQQG